MIKFIIKSIFCYIALALIFCFMYFFTSTMLTSMEASLTSMATYVLFLICIFLVWALTKLQTLIARSISFMYWLFCLGLTFVSFKISSSGPIDINVIFLHFSTLMFLIPELSGVITTYLNTETTYDGYGKVISERSWTSEEYTPGFIRKLAIMIVLTVILYVVEFFVGSDAIWTIFIIEAIYTGILTIANVLAFFNVIQL